VTAICGWTIHITIPSDYITAHKQNKDKIINTAKPKQIATKKKQDTT